MLSIQKSPSGLEIPPTAVGGSFMSRLSSGVSRVALAHENSPKVLLEHSPRHRNAQLLRRSREEKGGRRFCRKDLNYPPTAVGGIQTLPIVGPFFFLRRRLASSVASLTDRASELVSDSHLSHP